MKINVTFLLDANGILEVEAEVKDAEVEVVEKVKIDQYKVCVCRRLYVRS